MQPRSSGLYLALLLITAATARPQYDYDYEYDKYDTGEVVDVEEIVPEFTMEPQHLIAREGESAIIPCPSKNAEIYPMLISRVTPVNYLLFVGKVAVRRSEKHSLIGDSLKISNLEPNDSGDYLCSFSVSQGSVELTHTLEVQFAPVLRTKPGQEQQLLVAQGESVTLECDTYGNPEPVVTWTRPEGRLPSGSEEEEGNSLSLLDVDRHVAGYYRCSANNGIGEAASVTFEVVVEYPPEVVAEEVNLMADKDNQVKLNCLVYAVPAAVVIWTKDGQPIYLDSISMEQDGHRHTVTINQMRETDFGTYVCQARNSFGQSSVAIQVTERTQPTKEDEKDQIEEERGHQTEEERDLQIEEERRHQIQEERSHQVEEERGRQIKEERSHQTVAGRLYPIREEKKQAREGDWRKWIVILTNLAHLLGKMWGKL